MRHLFAFLEVMCSIRCQRPPLVVEDLVWMGSCGGTVSEGKTKFSNYCLYLVHVGNLPVSMELK